MEGEEEENILDAIFDEEDGEDVQMLDVEEGELLIDDNKNPNQRTADLGGESNCDGDVDLTVAPLTQESENQNQNEKPRNGKRNKKKKSKKNKGKKSGYGSNVTDINNAAAADFIELKLPPLTTTDGDELAEQEEEEEDSAAAACNND